MEVFAGPRRGVFTTTAKPAPRWPLPRQFKNAKTGKVFKMSYPCAMLNVMVAEHNTNDQFAVGARCAAPAVLCCCAC